MAESGLVKKIFSNCYTDGWDCITVLDQGIKLGFLGQYWIVTRSTTVLGTSSWIDIQINTPSTDTQGQTTVISNIEINNSAGLARLQVFELSTATTMVTGSASLNTYNTNRTSTNIMEGAFFSDPSNLGSSEISIYDMYIGSSGTRQMTMPAAISEEEYFVLKNNSTYIIRMINLDAASGYASMKLRYFEGHY